LGSHPPDGTCPHCDCRNIVHTFPALLDPLEKGREADALVLDSDASCFYHGTKSAETVCDGCGRFLCSLCDLPVGDQHLCPVCLKNSRETHEEPTLQRERSLHDSIALAVAIYPMLLVWVTIVTAPVTLFLVFRHRKTPLSLVRRSRWRAWLAVLFALMQIGGWLTLLAFFILKDAWT